MVRLEDAVRLEDVDRRKECRMVLREKKTSRSVAVESVHRFEIGKRFLRPQNRLDRFRIAAADDSRRLVADEIRTVLPQDAYVPRFSAAFA